jgi:capsular exopolysaccharide synthesis family protein
LVSQSNGPRAASIANAFAEQTVNYFQAQAIKAQRQTVQQDQTRTNRLAAKVQNLDNQLNANPSNQLLKARRTAIVQQYGIAFGNLHATISQGSPTAALSILQRATPIPVTSSGFVAPTSHRSRSLIGLLLGLALGCGLAVFLSRLDTRIRDRATLQRFMRIPVLTEVPALSRAMRGRRSWIVPNQPGSPAAEAYRSLRSSLQLVPSRPVFGVAGGDVESALSPLMVDPQRVRLLLVTSARSAEGKTTTVTNLAACFAETGRRVLILDCDFRNPDVHNFLGVAQSPGVSDAVAAGDEHRLADYVQPTTVEGVRVLTGGSVVEHPAVLANRMPGLFAQARTLADIVLIDSGPMLLANETVDLLPQVDSVLVVAKSGRPTNDQAGRLAELLAQVGVPVVGAVLIGTEGPWRRPGSMSGSDSRIVASPMALDDAMNSESSAVEPADRPG